MNNRTRLTQLQQDYETQVRALQQQQLQVQQTRDSLLRLEGASAALNDVLAAEEEPKKEEADA